MDRNSQDENQQGIIGNDRLKFKLLIAYYIHQCKQIMNVEYDELPGITVSKITHVL